MTRRSWTFVVAPGDAGLRLDQLLSARTGLSRRQAREALKLGGVQAAQKRIRVASKVLAPGTEVRVTVDDALAAVPQMELPVLFEDAWLLAVAKPAGLPCQGTQASDRHDLMALLGRQRPGQTFLLQHRLDTGTSGVIILAKSAEANVGPQFSAHEVRKTYLARTTRPVETCVVDAPIGRLRDSHPVRHACPGLGLGGRTCTLEDLLDPRPAQTALRPASPEESAGLAEGSYVVAEPRTGRTHQIRVHLAALGAPVLGDTLYGGAPASQLWLHAWRLILRHPVTGEGLDLVADPDRFRP
jgi:23S rRNA pseudouridine1911/1915/1917 synthase